MQPRSVSQFRLNPPAVRSLWRCKRRRNKRLPKVVQRLPVTSHRSDPPCSLSPLYEVSYQRDDTHTVAIDIEISTTNTQDATWLRFLFCNYTICSKNEDAWPHAKRKAAASTRRCGYEASRGAGDDVQRVKWRVKTPLVIISSSAIVYSYRIVARGSPNIRSSRRRALSQFECAGVWPHVSIMVRLNLLPPLEASLVHRPLPPAAVPCLRQCRPRFPTFVCSLTVRLVGMCKTELGSSSRSMSFAGTMSHPSPNGQVLARIHAPCSGPLLLCPYHKLVNHPRPGRILAPEPQLLVFTALLGK